MFAKEFFMKQFLFFMLAVVCMGCATTKVSNAIAPGQEYGNERVDNTPTVFEGIWRNDNQDGSVYFFRGNTFLTTDETEQDGNGGTFSFTDDKIIIYVTFYLIENKKVKPTDSLGNELKGPLEIELNYSLNGSKLVLWSNINENQKWVYLKD
jgi:hypothetical protein